MLHLHGYPHGQHTYKQPNRNALELLVHMLQALRQDLVYSSCIIAHWSSVCITQASSMPAIRRLTIT